LLGLAFFKSLVKEHGKGILRADRQSNAALRCPDPREDYEITREKLFVTNTFATSSPNSRPVELNQTKNSSLHRSIWDA
jgi:hypothetical protein